jgi:hypothetical protein
MIIDTHIGHDFLTKDVSDVGRNAFDVARDAQADFDLHYATKGFIHPISNDFVAPKYKNGKHRGKVTGKYILRADTYEPLGDVSGKYPKRDGYKHIFRTMETLFPETCTDMSVFGNGERLIMTQQIGDPIQLNGGDSIKPCVMTRMSLNSMWATGIFPIGQRPSCGNVLEIEHSLISVKATKNHDVMLTLRSAVLEASKLQADRLAMFARQASNWSVSDRQFHRMLNEILPEVDDEAPTRTQNLITAKRAAVVAAWRAETERYDDANAWLVFNAFQGAEQHKINQGFKGGVQAEQKSLKKLAEGKTPIADAAQEYVNSIIMADVG